MDKKIIGLVIAIIISIVAISGCIGENNLKTFENEKISFKYPENFTQTKDSPPSYASLDYLMYAWFKDNATNEDIGVDSIKATISLEQLYSNLEKSDTKNSLITDFTIENTSFNGKSAIKEKISYKNGDHVIFLNFIHDGANYQFAFWGDDISSVESLYDTIVPTIKLK